MNEPPVTPLAHVNEHLTKVTLEQPAVVPHERNPQVNPLALVLVHLMIYDSGEVSLEHLRCSEAGSRN